ncbi:flavodoxin family protein [Lagierella sp.]|uniref:flavodoxin family protein n=1 Tax=Lagierella sp. TaxID=2849657 RepID=UPI00262CA03F|nr:flavodoxin family protein [Lagierella sp.]
MEEIKISIIVGTNNNPSKTWGKLYNIFKDIKNRLLEQKLNICIYSLSGMDISMCRGCNSCFYLGKCKYFQDELSSIIHDIKSSDIVILASPVYLNNITGICKNFLDRMAYLTHILYFRKKLGIVFTYGSRSYTGVANEYLEMVMNYFGIRVVLNEKLQEYENDFKLENLKIVILKYIRELKGKKTIHSNEILNNIYKNIRNEFRVYKKEKNGFVYDYWTNHKIDQYSSFEELIDNEK